MISPLTHAFLALADDDTLPDQRTLPRLLVAAIAAIVLAAGLPLAVSMQHPVAALSSKISIAADLDE
jgi:enoyl-CoA hydratase/carnithine racemase